MRFDSPKLGLQHDLTGELSVLQIPAGF